MRERMVGMEGTGCKASYHRVSQGTKVHPPKGGCVIHLVCIPWYVSTYINSKASCQVFCCFDIYQEKLYIRMPLMTRGIQGM